MGAGDGAAGQRFQTAYGELLIPWSRLVSGTTAMCSCFNKFGFVRDDYVTTAIPAAAGLYAGDLFTVNALAAAVSEYYAKNTGLSYVGANVGAFSI
jgi:hypothetical protein